LFFGCKKIKHTPLNSNPITLISVVIAARNEQENIGPCLDAIAAQTYPSGLFEIIVVDDASTDNTAALVEQSKHRYSTLSIHIIRLGDTVPNPSPKKRALSEGISQSRGKLIVTTDADCTMGPGWLHSIASCYENQASKMIVSPVSLSPNNNFFEKMQALEFIGFSGTGGASLYYNKPLMCNGANLAFEKEAFNEAGGYSGNEHLASGDDMFLMLKTDTRYPGSVVFNKCPQAIVNTAPCKTLASFFAQRKRWASKSLYYMRSYIYGIGLLVYLLNLSIVTSIAFSIFYNRFAALFLVLFLTKVLLDLILLIPVSRFYKNSHLLLLILPAQLAHAFYVSFSGLFAFSRQYSWKERSLN
jgi:cellulose synthase/poly-beta-1,6-N-acetylglucosamine synthase-like glycosyltransferase